MKTEIVPIGAVKANPNNPRIIQDGKFDKLVESIREFPEMLKLRPIVVNADGVVLGGNMRLKACKRAGLKEIPVLHADSLTEAQQREFIIKDNVGFGEWDWELIAQDWDAEQLEGWGLDIPDFPEPEPEAVEDDFDEAPPEQPITVLGDFYEIGPHRLLCGDCTDTDQVARLMDGEKADMVFTDPPYGIEVVSGCNKVGGSGPVGGVEKSGKIVKAKTYSKIEGDDSTEKARDFYAVCVALEFSNYVIWGGNYFTDFLPPSRCWLIWDKENSGNFADVEMAWTSFPKSAKLYRWLWNGLARKGGHKTEGKTRVHPTQKPVGLFVEIFKDFDFNICLDGFLGSGSTMAAAHQTGRKCYGLEIDPKYCDVIIGRMLKLDPGLTVKRNGEPTNDFN